MPAVEPSARYQVVAGCSIDVSAWLPKPLPSHVIVRSTTTDWLLSIDGREGGVLEADDRLGVDRGAAARRNRQDLLDLGAGVALEAQDHGGDVERPG